MLTRSLLLLSLLVVACRSSAAPPAAPAPVLANESPPPGPPQKLDIDSRDILARTTLAPTALVRHVLFAWKELEANYGARLDPRAAKRTQAEAAKLAEDIAAQLRQDPSKLDGLIRLHSEDPGSLASDQPYEVTDDNRYVPEFKNLSLRLALGEVGIVTTRFGYHVIVRVAPPPPDPLESADILARPEGTGPVDVQHILIGWDGLDATLDAIAKQRTKAEADALATELLAKVRAGDDMTALMKQYSDDPASRDTGKVITIADENPSIGFASFKILALRLAINEAGLVKTILGWHIIKRVPPPPPDPLESVAIMNRTTVAERVKVKHILVGWKEVHADDPRGKTRTRKQLDVLVKATLKKLSKKGASFEASMKELSEDPGSAATGEPYDVTPDARLVKPFLNMSLRLRLDEIGVVKTVFGIHIIKRVE